MRVNRLIYNSSLLTIEDQQFYGLTARFRGLGTIRLPQGLTADVPLKQLIEAAIEIRRSKLMMECQKAQSVVDATPNKIAKLDKLADALSRELEATRHDH